MLALCSRDSALLHLEDSNLLPLSPKARRLSNELREIDDEKVRQSELAYASVCKHLERCETELSRFEEELRDKGQLKAPPVQRAELSLDHIGSVGTLAFPPATSRRNAPNPAHRREALDALGLGPPPSPSSASRKAGRGGRKISHKEMERQQRLSGGSADGAPLPVDDFISGGGVAPAGLYGAPFRAEYPDSLLPLAPAEASHQPLCGAVPAAQEYVIPERAKVAARTSGPPKVATEDWILAVVLRYNGASAKYMVLDVDAGDELIAGASIASSSSRQHTLPSRYVLPLPLTEPSSYSAYNELARGLQVLALYPDTTCFYKAFVHTPPSENLLNELERRDYLVEFEDENEASGRSEPMCVPQRYVLRLPQG